MIRFYFVLLFVFFVLSGCNKNLTEKKKRGFGITHKQRKLLGAQERSTATDRELALSDAENRLRTGGGLFGKKHPSPGNGDNGNENNQSLSGVGMPINPYL